MGENRIVHGRNTVTQTRIGTRGIATHHEWDGAVMKMWIVLVVGAGFLFAPGMIDPLAPINGSTIIGLGLTGLASFKLFKASEGEKS